ncbi:MAG: hypothetical protein K6E79_00425, partial [Pseudobutyrivibrio sp.]|nr:hypothetical protein [Pseudobutyrivibrio sp.]
MSRKKVENILKGVAVTGATVGGASVLGDANLSYAAELGNEQLAGSANGEIILEVAQGKTEEIVETTLEATQKQANETVNENVEQEAQETTEVASEDSQLEAASAAASDSLSTEDSEITSTSDSASDSLSTEDSEITSASNSVSDSLSTEDSEITSTSDSVSDSLSSENSEMTSLSTSAESEEASLSESLSTAMSEVDSDYESASNSFSEAGEDEYLENLIKQIEEAQNELKAAQQKAADTNKNLDHNSSSNNYYGYGDKLANLLIQYSFYQEGYVGEIVYSEWDSHSYDTNSVKVTYVDAAGQTKYAYFDYVTVDEDGNALVPGFYDSPNGGYQNNNPYVVDGIMVVEKTVQYTDANGNVLTWDYSTETAEDGTEKTVCHYYVNGSQIQDSVQVTLNDDNSFTLSWENETEEYSEAVNKVKNPYYDTHMYTSADGTNEYVSIGQYGYNYGFANNNLQNYYMNTNATEENNTVSVVERNKSEGTVMSTLVDAKGNAVHLVTKTTYSLLWKTETPTYEINGVAYSFYNSYITKNCDGTYSLYAYYDDASISCKQQRITLYTSANASMSSVTYNAKFVAKDREASDIYYNNDGQAKDGNFGVKGYAYFSEDDFNEGKDDYADKRSEFTSNSASASEAQSELASESASISESYSNSAV